MSLIPNISVPTADAQANGVGPLASLDSNPYSLTTLRYPIEGLGSTDVPHYVLFNINLPTSSKYISSGGDNVVANNPSASQQNYAALQQNGLKFQPPTAGLVAAGAGTQAAATAATSLISGGGISGAVTGAAKAAIGTEAAGASIENLTVQPKLKRIKTAIAIYMPETVMTSYDHDWQAVSLTEALGSLGLAVAFGANFGKNALDILKSTYNGITGGEKVYYNNAVQSEVIAQIAAKTGTVGPGFQDLTLRNIGKAVNPQVEMVFKGTNNRQYIFEFDFQARSQQEAAAIFNIIKTFKMYAAPELSSEGNGRYFIPPAQFDIKFYFMNTENPVIAKISTCALVNIQVNYNQSGPFATFTDGMPVHIHMALSFKEMDIITRELIDQYGY